MRKPFPSNPETPQSGADFDRSARHFVAPWVVFARFDTRQIGQHLPPAAPRFTSSWSATAPLLAALRRPAIGSGAAPPGDRLSDPRTNVAPEAPIKKRCRDRSAETCIAMSCPIDWLIPDSSPGNPVAAPSQAHAIAIGATATGVAGRREPTCRCARFWTG